MISQPLAAKYFLIFESVSVWSLMCFPRWDANFSRMNESLMPSPTERFLNNLQPSHSWQKSVDPKQKVGDTEENVVLHGNCCDDDIRVDRKWLLLPLEYCPNIEPVLQTPSLAWNCFGWVFKPASPFFSESLDGGQWLEGQSSQWSSNAETWTLMQQSSTEMNQYSVKISYNKLYFIKT